MTVTQETEIDIFVASKIGSFKHIKYHSDSNKNNKKCIENLIDVKTLEKGDEITCMRWGNTDQTQILIGRKNQKIETYSTLLASTFNCLTSPDPGHITGLGTVETTLISAASNGIVRIWPHFGKLKDEDDEITNEKVDTGGKLDTMMVCGEEPVFATGGEENDLKIYNIESKQCIFGAKNMPHDWLELRRPLWVSGAAFAPAGGGRVVAVCSRYGYVRLYDSRAQRRPVVNVEFPNMAATCIAPSFDERMYLVGFGRGQLQQVDLRAGRPDRGYRGVAGAVTDVAAALGPGGRRIVSTSLDRHLRVHCYQTKEQLYKQYLTSKLSKVLIQTECQTPLRNCPVDIKEEPSELVEAGGLRAANDMDDIFDNMETVGERKTPKKKSKLSQKEPDSKKLKPSTEGSTSVSEVASEEAIAQLLRSTEKTKRKRDKIRKEKRAKSVFFNA